MWKSTTNVCTAIWIVFDSVAHKLVIWACMRSKIKKKKCQKQKPKRNDTMNRRKKNRRLLNWLASKVAFSKIIGINNRVTRNECVGTFLWVKRISAKYLVNRGPNTTGGGKTYFLFITTQTVTGNPIKSPSYWAKWVTFSSRFCCVRALYLG